MGPKSTPAYCLDGISRLQTEAGDVVELKKQSSSFKEAEMVIILQVRVLERKELHRENSLGNCRDSGELLMSQQLSVDQHFRVRRLLESSRQSNSQSSHREHSCSHQSVWKYLLTWQALNRVHSNGIKLILSQELEPEAKKKREKSRLTAVLDQPNKS